MAAQKEIKGGKWQGGDIRAQGGGPQVPVKALTPTVYCTVSGAAFKLWQRLMKLGIPCEEPLRHPVGHPLAGQYRAQERDDGTVRVAYRFGGLVISRFLQSEDNRVYRAEILGQKEKILEQLDEHDIPHSLDGRDFVVELVEKDGGLTPRVRLARVDDKCLTKRRKVDNLGVLLGT